MKVTRKQAEDFVHLGEDYYSNLKIIKDMIYVYWGAVWMLWVPYAVVGRGLVNCIILTALVLLYTAAFYILKSDLVKKTYRLRFVTNTVSVAFMYLVFYLFTIFFVNVSDAGSSLWQDIEFTLCFMLFPLVCAALTLRNIKKNVYDRETPKNISGQTAGYACFGLGGMAIARLLEPYITQKQAVSIVMLLVQVLLLLISLTTPNALKLYYAFKYDITESAEGETTSNALVYDITKENIGKRVFKIILKAVIVCAAVYMLYGMSQLEY